ncbi:polymorphic toxin-type HINT domain-containing protein [Pendulispora albinea]|uniref:HINT domain-containing protein n=1 Tax=Pendulispora albinea TaxID=2741071 RepID=A0ABZ2LRR2_9BACT
MIKGASSRWRHIPETAWTRLFRDRRGVSSVEYAVLLVGILLLVAGGYRALGAATSTTTKSTTAVILGGTATVAGNGGSPYTGAGGTPGAVGPVCDGRGCSQPGGNCFVAGTPVATPSGERPIESLRAGDLVLTRGELDGTVSAHPVVQTFVRAAPSLVDVQIETADGDRESVRSTPEHPYWSIARGWVHAGELRANETLRDIGGRDVRVAHVVPVAQEALVYNIEVEQTHTYFVGHLATWVHNACSAIDNAVTGGGPPGVPGPVSIHHSLGTLQPNGVGKFEVKGPPWIIAVAPDRPWYQLGSSPNPQFNGQFIGLQNRPGSIETGRPGPQVRPPNLNPNTTFIDEAVAPSADEVFTDPLSGCTVIITPGEPPHLHHVLGSSLGDNPQEYETNLNNYLNSQGINPNGYPKPIIVKPNDYGWVTGDPSTATNGGFVYGKKTDGRMDWYLVKYGPDGPVKQHIGPVR